MGLAQKLFIERGGKPFKAITKRSVSHPCWPQIDRMLAQGCIAYIDYALAERLLRDHPLTGQEVAAFLCHLSIAARTGHLCIEVNTEGVSPFPAHTWLSDGDDDSSSGTDTGPPSPAEWQAITDLIIRGASMLPQGLVTEVSHRCPPPSTPICRFGRSFYFQRYWLYETLFLKHFQEIAKTPPTLTFDLTTMQNQIQALEEANKLLPEQAKAILAACTNGFTVICGGPGTGKTYTAGNLIKIFWMALSSEQQQNCEIALAAPTGKAAANLQKSLCLATDQAKGLATLKAKTLHTLLGIRQHGPQRDTAANALTADLIIVDESSMIDVSLMAQLLATIKPGARLIFLGDQHQLPPVAAGTLFSDIIQHLLAHSPQQLARLHTCLRMELKSIIDFADTINRGDSDSAIHALNASTPSSGISRLSLLEANVNTKTAQNALIEQVIPYFHRPSLLKEDFRYLLNAYQHFRILSPLRKGPFGIEELNQLIYAHLTKKKRPHLWFAAPIMLVHNDHQLELFNGETGVLVRHGDSSDPHHLSLQEEDFALFPSRNGDDPHAIRKLPALILPKYEYAYCLSVHKSQGSEFDHVLLIMPDGAERFGREVLYTAATRARKKLEVCGSDAVLRAAMERKTCRLSGIVQRLAQDG